jgi:hypothetical protein
MTGQFPEIEARMNTALMALKAAQEKADAQFKFSNLADELDQLVEHAERFYGMLSRGGYDAIGMETGD